MIFNDVFSTFSFLAGSNQRQRGGVYSWIHWKFLWGWYLHGLRDIDNYNPPINLWLILLHQIFSLAWDWSKRVTWLNMPQLKRPNILVIFPNFKTSCATKNIWRIVTTFGAKILSDICFWTLSVSHTSQFSSRYAFGKLVACRNR